MRRVKRALQYLALGDRVARVLRRRGDRMTIFQLKQLASATLHGAPRGVRWNYDRMELLVDGVIHSFGVLGGLVAAVALVVIAAFLANPPEIAAVSIYVAGLLVMLSVSAIYNLWPVSPVKWLLR